MSWRPNHWTLRHCGGFCACFEGVFLPIRYLIACTRSYRALSQGTSLAVRKGVNTFLKASRSDFTTVLPYLLEKSVTSCCSDCTISALDFSAASRNTASKVF